MYKRVYHKYDVPRNNAPAFAYLMKYAQICEPHPERIIACLVLGKCISGKYIRILIHTVTNKFLKVYRKS